RIRSKEAWVRPVRSRTVGSSNILSIERDSKLSIATLVLMLRFPLLVILSFIPLFAQTDAVVLGTIRDTTSSVVPNAKVTLMNVSTGTQQSMLTDANGNYEFPYVRLGDYTLRAEAPGFKASAAQQFTVTVNAHQRVDLALEVGQASEAVTV